MTGDIDYVKLFPTEHDDLSLGVPGPRWWLPEKVELIRDKHSGERYVEFRYRDSAPEKPSRLAPSPRRMLTDFVELARGDEPPDLNRVAAEAPALVLAFARRYGNLGVCEKHNLSCWHVVPPCPTLSKRRAGWVTLRERFSAWLTYSRLALAILNLVAEPQAPGRRSDRNRLDYFFGPRVAGPATAVNFWLSVCRIDLRLHGKPPRLALLPIPVGLAQLGIQLALVVTGRRAIALCDGCGRLFDVKRQPRRDRRRYCPSPDCGKKAAWRDAQRRKRAGLSKVRNSEGSDDDGTQAKRG
jgi:hypothetical protein